MIKIDRDGNAANTPTSATRRNVLGSIAASYVLAGASIAGGLELVDSRFWLFSLLIAILTAAAVGATAIVSVQIASATGEEADRRCKFATDNMPLGLLMYDASERIVVVNEPYIRLLGLSPDIVKPGCTFLELLKHRAAIGNLSTEPEKYRTEFFATLARDNAIKSMLKTKDGREISIACSPLPTGGWIATLERYYRTA